jgi:hypothetical protein
LDSICKIYERNKKTEKEKKKRKEKYEMDPGETFRPSRRNSPRPNPASPEPVPNLPLSPADRWDPIARVIPNLSPLSLETETVAGITPPLQYALLPAYFQL